VIVRRQLAFVTTAVGTINFEYVADRFGQHLVILRAKQPLDRSLVAARAFKWFTLTRHSRSSFLPLLGWMTAANVAPDILVDILPSQKGRAAWTQLGHAQHGMR
jgi:hypothetical protein